jgi:N6-adenosine-specific RNA methylase IME4
LTIGKDGGPGRGKRSLVGTVSGKTTLADLGVSKKVASVAQQLADMPTTTREQIARRETTLAKARRELKAVEIRKAVSLPDAKYRVGLADPPWSYHDKADAGSVQAGGAALHYPTMTIAELCALPVSTIFTDDAVLFLWVTSPLLFESLPVVHAWGFTYKASFVWDKVRHNMGHYNSVRHEYLLVCTRGRCTPDHVELFDSVQSIERTTHSTKPAAFRRIIDTLYPNGRRIELFARERVDGWDAYGFEAQGVA